MRKARWELMVVFLGFVLSASCGTKEQEQMAEPTQASEVIQAIFAPIKNDLEEKKNEGLKENLEKGNMSVQTAYNAVNQMFTLDETSKESLFCINEENGEVYFVNQNKDWYIYRIKDGEAELAVSMPARELYAYGGSLYFMIESYGKYKMGDIKDGDIYCYTPKDGTVELVYAAGVMAEKENADSCKMWVDENGIYFSYSGKETVIRDGEKHTLGILSNYYLPFRAEIPIEDTLQKANILRWKEYMIDVFRTQEHSASDYPSLVMRRKIEESVEYKELFVGRPRKYCVMEDKLYYVPNISEDIKIGVVNLLTGEKEEYSIWEELKKLYYIPDGTEISPDDFILSDKDLENLIEEWFKNSFLITTFTMTEQYFWVVHRENALIRIDRETKETTCFKMDGRIDALYTDGKQLYGMYALTSSGVSEMTRILTDEIFHNELLGTEYLKVEYLTD